jgi:RNA polymerase sigma-70 factor, ECF subfamily
MGAHERAILHRPGHRTAPHMPAVHSTGDNALVQWARAGNQDAFEELVQRYQRQIYALTKRMMGNDADAEDLTQESFIRAYRNIGRTQPDLNFCAWVHRIASNACLDALRRRKRIAWQPWDDAYKETLLPGTQPDNPETIAIANEERADVQRVLNRMSSRYRLALLLREYQGMSTAEIGEVMGTSRSAVKSILFRARQEFRDICAGDNDKQPVA